MARQFSHPQVQALQVHQSVNVFKVAPEVLKRRVDGYAKRVGKVFRYDFGEVVHLVTRLPDPGTQSEPQP